VLEYCPPLKFDHEFGLIFYTLLHTLLYSFLHALLPTHSSTYILFSMAPEINEIVLSESHCINITTTTPQGTRFMPDTPIEQGVQPWPESLTEEFQTHLFESKNRFVLTSKKRSDIQYHLKNPHSKARGTTKAERQRDQNKKTFALRGFELQDNQVYQKAHVDSNGDTILARYAACTWDIFDLIYKTHQALQHFGKYITFI
jgi:hypothetical protein